MLFSLVEKLEELAAPVNEAALSQVPYTLKAWTAVKGPHAQVAALFDDGAAGTAPGAAGSAEGVEGVKGAPALPTLKSWFDELAPRAHVRQMQMEGLC